jgi:hypothetical protein
MKTCPVCDTEYPDLHTTCPTDGAVLIGSHELNPGSLVRGKYRIVRKLGDGGMGIVYLAEHTAQGGGVALKFLAGDLGRDPRFIKRFRIEARAAYPGRYGMDHPRIIALMSKGCDAGDSDSCSQLAVAFHQGFYGYCCGQNDSRVLGAISSACEKTVAVACTALGESYRLGLGLPKDTEKAKRLFERGCTLGNQQDCALLKQMQLRADCS